MEKYFNILKRCPLFQEIRETDLPALLSCLETRVKRYEKNGFIFMPGDSISGIGIVLSGSVHIIREDFWGNRTILANMERSELFGEAFSFSETERLAIGVFAAQASDILFVDCRKIVETCSAACSFHTRLIKNMLRILAEKNIMLTQKMEVITQRTTREKLLVYLSLRARQAGSNTFYVPFNRQELAEYLSVNRSAMSTELSKMEKEGILKFRLNRFELLKPVERL